MNKIIVSALNITQLTVCQMNTFKKKQTRFILTLSLQHMFIIVYFLFHSFLFISVEQMAKADFFFFCHMHNHKQCNIRSQ